MQVIFSCLDNCPFLYNKYTDVPICKKTMKKVLTLSSIPVWCPLTSYENKKGGNDGN